MTAEKVADGVWFLGGGSHNSVAIEMGDHLVLVETPLNDARTDAVLGHAKTLRPASRSASRSTATSTSTMPAACEQRLPKVRRSSRRRPTCAYFEHAFAQANRVRPDRMAQKASV